MNSNRTFLGFTVLAHLLLYVTIFCAIMVIGLSKTSLTKNVMETGHSYDSVTSPCLQPTGQFVTNDSGVSSESINCDGLCGTDGANRYYAVSIDEEDIFINGERPDRLGIYCVRIGTSVTRCNKATSKLVRTLDGQWSCQPVWPSIFGGADGGDILVCGGKLNDHHQKYEYRLPPSNRLDRIVSPYDEIKRFYCAPGEYFDGPRDYMNNEYIALETDRFRRVRNHCAKYVANAVGIIKPLTGTNNGLCNCLATHGRLRRRKRPSNEAMKIIVDDSPSKTVDRPTDVAGARVTNREPRKHHNRNDTRKIRSIVEQDQVSSPSPTVFSVPYACSPCVVSGDLLTTEGIFNVPVQCTKSNQRYFDDTPMADLLPCGSSGFSSASQPSCVNVWLYVGDKGMSYAVKKATNSY